MSRAELLLQRPVLACSVVALEAATNGLATLLVLLISAELLPLILAKKLSASMERLLVVLWMQVGWVTKATSA